MVDISLEISTFFTEKVLIFTILMINQNHLSQNFKVKLYDIYTK